MLLERAKLLTIVVESILESKLKDLVTSAGAQGYTIIGVTEGKGKHGVRSAQGEIATNTMMMVIVSDQVARTILNEIERKWSESFAVLAFLQDADTARWTSAMAPRG